MFFARIATRPIPRTIASDFSLSSPVITDPRRGIGRKYKMDERSERRARVYAQGRYLLRTDISRFYPSVYTHSIPWAIHGKEYSKQHRFDKNLGNQLDKLVQSCQYGQTNGIPIGPDTTPDRHMAATKSFAEVFIADPMMLKNVPLCCRESLNHRLKWLRRLIDTD